MKEERRGEIFIGSAAALWGVFPVLTAFSLRSTEPLVLLGYAELFAALLFAGTLTLRGTWHELARKEALKDILLVTLFIGILYYIFTFIGLSYTTPGNASIIGLTEIFFAYVLFNLIRKEKLPKTHLWGALLMLVGAAIVLYPNTSDFKIGDFLIVAAAAVAPMGNFFQRRARSIVSSDTIMFTRSIVSAVAIFALAALLGEHVFPSPEMPFLLFAVNGVFFMGLSKIFWIEGIHRISVTKANALSCISPAVALVAAYGFLGIHPTVWQLSAIIPMLAGVILLGRTNKAPQTTSPY